MKSNGICYILGAGEHYGPPPARRTGDFVIAADGEYWYARQYGMEVDLLVGDFDSLEQPPKDQNTLMLPQEKDDTDMLAAIREGYKRGYRAFYIYGGTGRRLDHTLANIQCIANFAAKGARGYLHDKGTVITAIHNDSIAFPAGCEGAISVFSHSDTSQGVFETGLKYTLADATLTSRYPVGVSNEFTGAKSTISVRAGTLVIIYPQHIKEVDP